MSHKFEKKELSGLKLLFKSFRNIRNYILGMLLIVSTRGIWLYEVNSRISYGQVSFALSLLLTLIGLANLLKYKRIRIKKTVFTKITITVSMLAFYFFVNRINRVTYTTLFAAPIITGIIYFIFEKESDDSLWCSYSDLVCILAAISLIFYIGGTLLQIIPSTRTATFEWAYVRSCKTYFNLYYESQKIKGATLTLRNCGIFPEAPMYNMVLCTALAVEMFLKPQISKKRIQLLMITIVTTLSSTGYLFIIFALLFKYAVNTFKTNRLTGKKILFIVYIALGGLALFFLMNYRLTYQSGINSNAVRFDHLWACLKTWSQHIVDRKSVV